MIRVYHSRGVYRATTRDRTRAAGRLADVTEADRKRKGKGETGRKKKMPARKEKLVGRRGPPARWWITDDARTRRVTPCRTDIPGMRRTRDRAAFRRKRDARQRRRRLRVPPRGGAAACTRSRLYALASAFLSIRFPFPFLSFVHRIHARLSDERYQMHEGAILRCVRCNSGGGDGAPRPVRRPADLDTDIERAREREGEILGEGTEKEGR